MCAAAETKDKVKMWVLPVEEHPEQDEYIISFPDDLLEAANLKEGDQVEWIDQGDGSWMMKKIDKVEETSVHENDWNKDYEV